MRNSWAPWVISLTMLLTACGKSETTPPDRSDGLRNIRFGYFPIAYLTPLFVAQEKGFFEEAGLKVELKDMRGSPQVTGAMASGDLDGGSVSFVSTVMARKKGVPIRIVASFGHSAPGKSTQGLAVLKSSGITSMEQLSGKTVGAMMKGTEPWFHTVTALREHGVTNYKYVELRQEEVPPALQAGTIDVGNIGEPWRTMMGDKLHFVYEIKNISGAAGYAFGEEFIKEHPEAIKAWLAAIGKAIAYIADNDEDARRILSKYTKVPTAVVMKVTLPSWDPQSRILVDEADKISGWLVEFGMAENKPPLESIIDFSFSGRTTLAELYP